MPDGLDPQVREFAGQLRRLVDRSGLSVAAIADRTGYSKTSWDRYLNGRLLAPKGAIVALAEVTGTNPVHLTTMWELAERAWSRSEMRHDMTMEAIRISQARAALGEADGAPAAGGRNGRVARAGGGTTVTPGVAGPAGVAPTMPPRPMAPDADVRDAVPGTPDPYGGPAGSPASPGGNSWGLAGYGGPSRAGGHPEGPAGTPVPPGPYGEPPRDARSVDGGSGPVKRRLVMFLAGLVGVLVVAGGVFFLTGGGSGAKDRAENAPPSPTAATNATLPPGVKCSGDTCSGQDAELMGCSGDLVTTAKTVTVGTTVLEVRYSRTCGAAWGRVTRAVQGDSVEVTAGSASQRDAITVAGDTIAYTPMVAVRDAGDATACATLASGQKGCTP
ncbi:MULTISPECIES: XRE family transcriptional regulator [unclassified Streptomyces]|uniref:helix-turn-helix domain-containing protein n=1 Tax=unclassified Streptomyces TaxID=2593676 RepID=UPI001F04B113|nr:MULTISPECIES: XRE family transcriptional regulator [unclassified Streptomyces]